MANKIEDFGEKIGGARKDMYCSREALFESISGMNELECQKMIKKDKLWPLDKDIENVRNGMSPFIAYWIRQVRKMLTPGPRNHYSDEDRWTKYTQAVLEIKEMVMEIKDEDGTMDFYKTIENLPPEKKELWSYCVFLFDISKIKNYHTSIKWNIEHTNFPYGTRKQETKKRKVAFVPPQLECIHRTGEDYRSGRHISPEAWQKEFDFRGVEFGNWMTQLDRQVSMDYCYDALQDLCRILSIDTYSVTFNGNLAIAFGARGKSRALAHYEPARQVINLTKMRGAGTTAHEWFHALDHYIAQNYNVPQGQLASEYAHWRLYPDTFLELVQACLYKPGGGRSDFFRNSRKFDSAYSKDSHGYWSSTCEMLARAFACYCRDKYQGKSDYLFAHSESAVARINDTVVKAIPEGEERERINRAFDAFFEELKSVGILKHKEHEVKEISLPDVAISKKKFEDMDAYIKDLMENGVQMSFFSNY